MKQGGPTVRAGPPGVHNVVGPQLLVPGPGRGWPTVETVETVDLTVPGNLRTPSAWGVRCRVGATACAGARPPAPCSPAAGQTTRAQRCRRPAANKRPPRTRELVLTRPDALPCMQGGHLLPRGDGAAAEMGQLREQQGPHERQRRPAVGKGKIAVASLLGGRTDACGGGAAMGMGRKERVAAG